MTEKNTKYIAKDGLRNEATHLEVSVYYSKGNGYTVLRGYYISVTPVRKTDNTVSFILLSGENALIAESKRYSDKSFAVALEHSKALEKELIDKVLAVEMMA